MLSSSFKALRDSQLLPTTIFHKMGPTMKLDNHSVSMSTHSVMKTYDFLKWDTAVYCIQHRGPGRQYWVSRVLRLHKTYLTKFRTILSFTERHQLAKSTHLVRAYFLNGEGVPQIATVQLVCYTSMQQSDSYLTSVNFPHIYPF